MKDTLITLPRNLKRVLLILIDVVSLWAALWIALIIRSDQFFIPMDGYELTKEIKAHLLTIATQDVKIDGIVRPLLIAVTTTTASLYKCYSGELRHIKYPVLD